MNFVSIGAAAMALAVVLGAFGAHGLKDRLDAYSLGIWEKAVFYHFIHAIGILLVAIMARVAILDDGQASKISLLLVGGIALFSGSLYVLALTGIRTLGAVTPFGGICFIGAWVMLVWSAMGKR